jgi:hypothetical protein
MAIINMPKITGMNQVFKNRARMKIRTANDVTIKFVSGGRLDSEIDRQPPAFAASQPIIAVLRVLPHI